MLFQYVCLMGTATWDIGQRDGILDGMQFYEHYLGKGQGTAWYQLENKGTWNGVTGDLLVAIRQGGTAFWAFAWRLLGGLGLNQTGRRWKQKKYSPREKNGSGLMISLRRYLLCIFTSSLFRRNAEESNVIIYEEIFWVNISCVRSWMMNFV